MTFPGTESKIIKIPDNCVAGDPYTKNRRESKNYALTQGDSEVEADRSMGLWLYFRARNMVIGASFLRVHFLFHRNSLFMCETVYGKGEDI